MDPVDERMRWCVYSFVATSRRSSAGGMFPSGGPDVRRVGGEGV
jgi:hypothetical protein